MTIKQTTMSVTAAIDDLSEKDREILKLQKKLALLTQEDGHPSILTDPTAPLTAYANIDRAAETLVHMRDHQIAWLEGFIHEMDIHEGAVNAVKTTGAVVAVLSTAALFTPLAPFGAIGLIGSGVAGAATSIGDLIANQVKNGQVQDHINESKEAEAKFSAAIGELQKAIDEIVKVTGCTKEVATGIFLGIIENVKATAGAGMALSAGAMKIYTCAPAVKGIYQLTKLGVPAMHAARMVSASATAAEAGAAGVAAGRVALDTTKAAAGGVVGAAMKGLALFGAVVSVADCIMSWVNGNPTKNGAIDAKNQIAKNRDEIVEHRKNWAPYVINIKVE